MNRVSRGPAGPLPTYQIQDLLKRGFDALNAGRTEEAGECCRRILESAPKNVEAHFLVGLIATEDKQPRIAIQAFGSVTTLDPSHAAGWAHLARAFIRAGQPKRAAHAVEKAIEAGTKDPMVADLIGTTLSALGDQKGAKKWYSRAVKTVPRSAPFNLNLASSLIFLGEKDDAKAALERVFKERPDSAQAHWRYASLSKARDHTHLEKLHALMERYERNPRELSFVAYAAGKEHEDLGEWDEAFACFETGAKAKRQTVEYDEDQEIEMFAALENTFTAEWMDRDRPGNDSPKPIFIVGQPRTGTTLVERIITSHSMVHSAGELQQLRMAIRRNTDVVAQDQFSAELVRASAEIEPEKIGTTYLKTSESMQGDLPRFVDKLPTNYLHIPLIAKALPNAKIIHVVRNPMDSCFSSFKQLFAEAYFHSYTLEEMARHHVRYRRLMDHWRNIAPDAFIDVEYEDVVRDLETNARRMIEYLELPWEDACLEFHRQEQAVTTASAVQVREKAHTRSVGRWREYERQLEPVAEILRDAGIEPDASAG